MLRMAKANWDMLQILHMKVVAQRPALFVLKETFANISQSQGCKTRGKQP